MTSKTSPQASLQNDIPAQLEFSRIGTTRVQVVFDEPDLSSDGGALLLREATHLNGIIEAMAGAIKDERKQAYVRHTLKELLTQRSMQICHGYEDANDCDFMREDAAFKAAAGRTAQDSPLASLTASNPSSVLLPSPCRGKQPRPMTVACGPPLAQIVEEAEPHPRLHRL